MTTVVDLPFPVSVNALYANVRNVGRVKTARYKTWLNAARWEVKRQRPEPVRGPYEITVLVQRKRGRRDLGNLHKCLSDLLVSHGVIEDDSLEQKVILCWSDVIEGCRVFLEPVAAPAHRSAA